MKYRFTCFGMFLSMTVPKQTEITDFPLISHSITHSVQKDWVYNKHLNVGISGHQTNSASNYGQYC